MFSEDKICHEAKSVIVDCRQQFPEGSESVIYFFTSKHSYIQVSDMSTHTLHFYKH